MEIKNVTVNAGRSIGGDDYAQQDVGVRITDSSVVFFDIETSDHLLVLKRADFNLIHELQQFQGASSGPFVLG